MRNKRLFVGTLAALLALPAVFAVACHDHDDGEDASPACTDPAQISLPNCESGPDRFSDEACTIFDDALSNRTATDDARAATITAPTAGQVVPAATPFTFTWTAPTALRRPSRARSLAALAWRAIDPLPEAEAHCEAFTGRAYELRFSVNGAVVMRRQTSALSWTPDAIQWQRLVAAVGSSTVELRVYTANFSANQINSGSGPFAPMAARSFTIR